MVVVRLDGLASQANTEVARGPVFWTSMALMTTLAVVPKNRFLKGWGVLGLLMGTGALVYEQLTRGANRG